ncbi:MAG: hypothetical protein AAFV88_13800 [Planctomycetota bacterium]
MPVNDLGFRGWTGERSAQWLRPLVIARGGISLILKRRWLRFMLIIAWLPVLVPAFGIFAFEFSSTDPVMRRRIVGMAQGLLQNPELAEVIATDPDRARHEVWATLILYYFRVPQLFAMVGLIGLIAPLLISYDLRTKAYLMYFSRPLTPTQYIIGKSAVIWFFLAGVATVPALLLYILGVFLSSEFSVVAQTWDIPLRILIASVVLMLPTTAIAILYSSFTSESRYAVFSWFATWVMGAVTYQALSLTSLIVERQKGSLDLAAANEIWDRWRIVSPYHILGKVESWVFGIDRSSTSVIPFVLILTAITVIGFWIVRRRIVARLSV